jgi:hypothetical protein
MRKHAMAGICDCRNYKCLNCQNVGHHCRESKCPAREKYRPRHAHRPGRGRDKGKGRAHDAHPKLDPQPNPVSGQDEALTVTPSTSLIATPSTYKPPTEEEFRRQMEESMGDWREGWGFNENPPSNSLTTMEVDSGPIPSHAPAPQQTMQSPSRPQSSAANQSLN